MYKTRLAQWGYVKNLKKTRQIDWQDDAVMQRERLRSGRSTSARQAHCKEVKLNGPGKYLRRRKMYENDLLAEAAANGLPEGTRRQAFASAIEEILNHPDSGAQTLRRDILTRHGPCDLRG